MSEYMTNEKYALSINQKVVFTARDMLNRKISFILGARVLSSVRHEIPKMESDQDFDTFLLIDSETDSLPIGNVQQYWDQNALERLKPEIVAAEDWARKTGSSACQSLINRFSILIG